MRGTRASCRRIAAALPVALLLAGCGIQRTGVVEAGGPATIEMPRDRRAAMLLFFRSPDGGLSPVSRPNFQGSAADLAQNEVPPRFAEKAIMALLAGPKGADETAAGLSTSLPRATGGESVGVKPVSETEALARVPVALDELDDTALRQLICTIAYAVDDDGRALVRMTGTYDSAASGSCDLDVKGGTEREAVGTRPPTTTG
ncbi:hypothetical protein [Streptomyces cadmiisoli]|uniref:GerMN domain-containing protein n=1 Tax=Streptomyces cadmiisoli TaxID=2184053 RepID=A0A2Z4JEZ6_9ACTN|nr:hypothetical protein [Streptomyces cadmiisoli]AWW43113.1 hypothetical protein DN051_41565 [Streptomyces cadmiisoli]